MSLEQRSGMELSKIKIVRPNELVHYLRTAPSFEMSEIIKQPAAPEMFLLVRESARRAHQELAELSRAVTKGTFDKNTYDITRRQIIYQVGTDPLFELADTYWKTESEESLPLFFPKLLRDKKTYDPNKNDILKLDGIPYKGSTARMMRFLLGTTPHHPLFVDNLAPLVYPTDLDFPASLEKTKSVLGNISDRYMAQHPNYHLLRIKNQNNKRKTGYSIEPVNKNFVPALTSLQTEKTNEPEQGKQSLEIAVHRDKNYIKIGNKVIHINSDKKIPQNAQDALRFITYLANHQGEWISSSHLLNELYKDLPLTYEQKLSRNRQVKKWINKFVTVNDKPIVRRSGKGTSGSYYGIMDFDVSLDTIDISFEEASHTEGVEVVAVNNPTALATKKRQEKVLFHRQHQPTKDSTPEHSERIHPHITIGYYAEQALIQLGESFVSLRGEPGQKGSRAGRDAMKIIEMLGDFPEHGLSASEILVGLYGQDYVDKFTLSQKRFQTAIEWINKNLKHNNKPLVLHNGLTVGSKYRLNNIKVHIDNRIDTFTLQSKNLIICPDGKFIKGKTAEFMYKILQIHPGGKIPYTELAHILYDEEKLAGKTAKQKAGIVPAYISRVTPLLEKYFGLVVKREREKGVSYLSTEQAKAQHDGQKLTQSEMLSLVSGLQERKKFIFPNGAILVDKPALAAYVLLKAAPKYVDVTELQQVLYARVDEATTNSFNFLRYKIKRALEAHLSDVEVVRTYNNRQIGLEVRGIRSDFDIDGAFKSWEPNPSSNSLEQDITAHSLITELKSPRAVFWDEYSTEEKKALLTVIAYELNKPASMLLTRDISQQKYQVLEGQTVAGLFYNTREKKSPDDPRTTITFLLDSVGISPTVEDVIEQIKQDKLIPRGRATWPIIYELVSVAASESHIPIEMMGYPQFLQKYKFLGGKNLERFLQLATSDPERTIDERPLKFLRRKLGLSELPLHARAKYRYSEIKRMYNELTREHGQELTQDFLYSWSKKIAGLYQSYFYDFAPDEVQNEAFISVATILSEVTDPNEIIVRVYQYMEKIFSEKVIRRYKEESLYKPFGETDEGGKEKTQIENLVYQAPVIQPTEESFSPELQKKISKLGKEEQFILSAIMVNTWSFDIIVEAFVKRFKRKTDIDELQDYYQNALLTLRSSLAKEAKENE